MSILGRARQVDWVKDMMMPGTTNAIGVDVALFDGEKSAHDRGRLRCGRPVHLRLATPLNRSGLGVPQPPCHGIAAP
jgi:hypothetical protein